MSNELDKKYNLILFSRLAYDKSPIHIVEIMGNKLIYKYHNKYYKGKWSYERLEDDKTNQKILYKDVPYLLIGRDVYPANTFVQNISDEYIYTHILMEDYSEELFLEGDLEDENIEILREIADKPLETKMNQGD